MKKLLRIPAYIVIGIVWILVVMVENVFGATGKASDAVEDFYYRHWR